MPQPRFVIGLLPLALSAILSGPARAAATARPVPSRAAPAAAFTLEHALTLRSISDLSWSADGRRLAFVVSEPDTAEDSNNQDLWMLDLSAHAPALRLTRHPKPDISPTFSPSGDTLAFVGNRGSGDDARPGIYMMSLRGGEPWAFGSYPEGVGEVHWSPDGRWLAFVMADTLPKSVREWRRRKWDQVVEDEPIQFQHVWLVDVATGAQRMLTRDSLFLWHLRWSPDSRRLAFITSPTGKPDDGNLEDIGVLPVSGGPIHRLGVIGGEFVWSPDGRRIAIATGGNREAYVQKTDLWVVPVDGGAPRNLTGSFDGDAATPCWSPSGDTLYFHAEQGVTTRLAAVPASGGPVTLLEDRAGEAGAMVAAGDGRVAWIESQPTRPVEVWTADRANAVGRPATAINDAVARLTLATTRTVRWRSSDGVAVEGLLVRPAGAPEAAALKTVVQLHGGPYGSRYALGFQPVPQYLAAAGYQVFLPNFRSSSGYGTAFMLRRRSDWGGQDWRDVMSGVDSLVRRGLADGRRLAVWGGSYGGYLSAWAITQTDRFRAACVFAGAVDLGAHYGQSDIHRYRAFDFDGPPWVSPENWRRSSPITYIEHARTPTLILVGENDPRVPMPQSQQLYTALRTLHVPVEYVHYPREGHGLREPRHRADQLVRLRAWLDRWVR